MRDKTREALEIFVEKASKLGSYRFIQSSKQLKFSYSFDSGNLQITGPDSEEIDAYVLNFRYFIQKNERSSFRWLADNVLDDPGLSDDWKREFGVARKLLNDYLDKYPPIKVFMDEAVPTRRDIMYVFMYGNRSHETQRERFKKWTSDPYIAGEFECMFVAILRDMFTFINHVAELSKKELGQQP